MDAYPLRLFAFDGRSLFGHRRVPDPQQNFPVLYWRPTAATRLNSRAFLSFLAFAAAAIAQGFPAKFPVGRELMTLPPIFPGLAHLGEAHPRILGVWLSIARQRSCARVGQGCRQVVKSRNDVRLVGRESSGLGRLLVLRARDAQTFAKLGVEHWLPRRKSHHARKSEETRGGEISGDQRVVSLAHERIRGGSEPKMKRGA